VNQEFLRKIVADALKVPLSEVLPNASSDTLENWDSLRHLEIIMAVESATRISFATSEIVSLTSLEKIEQALVARGWKP
jgi:acyl carrier protein